jgi:hypothetical protein
MDGFTSQETVIGTTTTDANGAFILYGPPAVAPHAYKVRIPAAQFAAAGPLNFLVPSVLTTSGNDDNLNQNAQPAATPEITGVVHRRVYSTGVRGHAHRCGRPRTGFRQDQ